MEYNNAEKVMRLLEEIPDEGCDYVVSIESRKPVGDDQPFSNYTVSFVTDWEITDKILEDALERIRGGFPGGRGAYSYSIQVRNEAPVLIFF